MVAQAGAVAVDLHGGVGGKAIFVAEVDLKHHAVSVGHHTAKLAAKRIDIAAGDVNGTEQVNSGAVFFSLPQESV